MAKKANRPTVDPMAGLAYGAGKAEREELRRQEEQNKQEELRKEEEKRQQEEALKREEAKRALEEAQKIEQEKFAEEQKKLAEQEASANDNKSAGQGNLVNSYVQKTLKKPQARTARLNIVVTPAISQRLDQLVESRAIRSRNDLVNFLLESYFQMLDEND